MKIYYNLSGNSGITAYQFEDKHINIVFTDGTIYRYSYLKPGKIHIEKMKELALLGKGLATYINKYIRDNYEKKIK